MNELVVELVDVLKEMKEVLARMPVDGRIIGSTEACYDATRAMNRAEEVIRKAEGNKVDERGYTLSEVIESRVWAEEKGYVDGNGCLTRVGVEAFDKAERECGIYFSLCGLWFCETQRM